MALDFYAGARNGDFDVGILFSMDYDLAPAIEKVRTELPEVIVETAVWYDGTSQARRSIVDQGFRNAYPLEHHLLDAADYRSVRDTTNYTLKRRQRRT